jgi:hypothetical protein
LSSGAGCIGVGRVNMAIIRIFGNGNGISPGLSHVCFRIRLNLWYMLSIQAVIVTVGCQGFAAAFNGLQSRLVLSKGLVK